MFRKYLAPKAPGVFFYNLSPFWNFVTVLLAQGLSLVFFIVIRKQCFDSRSNFGKYGCIITIVTYCVSTSLAFDIATVVTRKKPFGGV